MRRVSDIIGSRSRLPQEPITRPVAVEAPVALAAEDTTEDLTGDRAILALRGRVDADAPAEAGVRVRRGDDHAGCR